MLFNAVTFAVKATPPICNEPPILTLSVASCSGVVLPAPVSTVINVED